LCKKKKKMAALTGGSDQEKLACLCERTYKDQAVWYVRCALVLAALYRTNDNDNKIMD